MKSKIVKNDNRFVRIAWKTLKTGKVSSGEWFKSHSEDSLRETARKQNERDKGVAEYWVEINENQTRTERKRLFKPVNYLAP